MVATGETLRVEVAMNWKKLCGIRKGAIKYSGRWSLKKNKNSTHSWEQSGHLKSRAAWGAGAWRCARARSHKAQRSLTAQCAWKTVSNDCDRVTVF